MSPPTEKPFSPNEFVRFSMNPSTLLFYDSKQPLQLKNPNGITISSVQPRSQYDFPLSLDRWATTARLHAPPPSSFAPCPKTVDDPTTSTSDGDKAEEPVEFRCEAEGSPENQSPVFAAEKTETRTSLYHLRPRKRNSKTDSVVMNESTRGELSCDTSNRGAETRNMKRKIEKKQEFSISLTKREIEEDIYAITGLITRLKQPKNKRSRAVKRHLDQLCPGKGLHLISDERYAVRDRRV